MKNDHLIGVDTGEVDVALIGGGIMNATLGILLRQLNPGLSIQILEALPQVAMESSNAWNNAGTGHAGLCELNYTPKTVEGGVDITKAVDVNECFETSKHFWGALVQQGIIPDPSDFIRSVAHMSFVVGRDNRDFLRKRRNAMIECPLFADMEFSDDPAQIGEWAPLLLQGRSKDESIAATRIGCGTDVNYGALTRMLFKHLTALDGVSLFTETTVRNLRRLSNGCWELELKHSKGGKASLRAGFVFIGAGGYALPLLQKSGIPEGKGYGGFPVSGQFLVCNNKSVVEQHRAKVYGMAEVGAPPMSVPHLDSRVINNQPSLLFGPFAGFSPKFLKKGSYMDLFNSVRLDNIGPMLVAGKDNMALTKYLINQCRQKHRDRCDSLRKFFPAAVEGDWTLAIAGQRVQIIKKEPQKMGVLQFGTEVVASADGSLAAMLGASPGASTSVSIMLDVLEKCFARQMASDEWKAGLAAMVPAYGIQLEEDADTFSALRQKAHGLLKLDT